jgi:acyl phosphate:glycerol-3-phosphate acyltransferase
MLTLFFCLSAYLIGSLSTAIIVCRLTGHPDPRTQGSGNPGATNVSRFTSKKIAAIVLGGDLAKGLVVVLLAKSILIEANSLGAVGIAVVIGHCFPLYYRFQGGKGVATSCGALLALAWPVATIAIVIWCIASAAFGYASLSAVVVCLCLPLLSCWLAPSLGLPITIMALLVLSMHHRNIRRLLIGTEPKSF